MTPTSAPRESGEKLSPWFRRPEWWVLGGAFALFFGLLLRPLLSAAVIAHEDIEGFYFPTRWWYGEQLHRGLSFLWNPNLFGGFYAHGEGQVGMFHPLHLLLYSLLPGYAAFDLNVVLAYAALALGTFFLFRAWGVSQFSAATGAFLGTFGGYLSLSFGHINALEIWANTPWILLCSLRLWRARSARIGALYFGCIGLLTASQAYLGYPPFLYFSLLLEGWYMLYLFATDRRFWRAASFAAAIAIGLAAGLAQLWPTWEMSRHSARAAPTFEFLSNGSLGLAGLSQWLNPSSLGDNEIAKIESLVFWGTGTLLLAIWWMSRSVGSRKSSSLTKALVTLAACSLFFACGRHNGVFRFYYAHAPFSLFRVPVRYLLLAHFSVVSMAVLALDPFLAEGGSGTGRRFRWAPIVFFAGALALLAVRVATPLAILPKLTLAIAGGGLVMATAACFWWAAHGALGARRTAVCALILEVTIFFGYAYSRLPLFSPSHPSAAMGAMPPVPPPGPVTDSTISDSLLTNDYRLAGGYATIEPVEESRLGFHSEIFEKLLGVRAIRRNGGEWQMVPLGKPVPRVRLITQTEIRAVPDLTTMDPSSMATADEDLHLTAGSTGEARWIRDQPGDLEMEIDTSGTMLGVLTERYHDDWRLLVSGKEERALRVDGDLLGFVVPAGKHIVRLRFSPPYLKPLIHAGAGLVCALLALIGWGVTAPRD